ncbi:respiratory nitrate reductase subunit gamma [Demequina aurantiaca]|uniref:respiratory nitrate reductase subunit gamma n=1 Tax=Demequina aurantiaca TaxID=676200 RepID=UPI000A02C81C|nr:respiratory nitrate reductase subunit gamma [Demequina aurantiaca]
MNIIVTGLLAAEVSTTSAEVAEPSSLNLLLWIAFPYVAIATIIVGLVWRYRYDKFGWTTRSSQSYENKIMHVASPLFHYGIIAVFFGHILGLMIPETWTEAIGLDEHTYHMLTLPLSLIAGAATLIGLIMLIFRRRTTAQVFQRTTKNDKVMYVFLGAAILLGVFTSWAASGIFDDGHNYREDVAVWFRSILIFQPQPEAMASAPAYFQIHAVAGMLLFCIWPFTRLVHVFSVPLQYLMRPYVVYRKKSPHRSGNRTTRRGWEPTRTD